ncbi:hypothetical protein, partial [Helicobacter pylori]|uniref:hypothetical protein n=1 Tax=Helicobacter pylori TaxID=210 RepID=UPI000953440A
EWLKSAGENLKNKMKEYEGFFSDFNTSMRSNEQEVTDTLNANTQNIKSEIKKLENQIIETATRLLTSYQIFLNNAKESANNEITTNKTESIQAIAQAKESANNEITTNKTESIQAIAQAKESANNEITTNKTESIQAIAQAKESATTQINTNKQEVLNNITQERQQATTEITEAKKTAFNELLETLNLKASGLFAGVYYIYNAIYIKSGWEQKIKDLSDYELEKSKKYEIEVFFSYLTSNSITDNSYFGLKTIEGFLKESIQKITYKYASQIYYKKLLVENASGVLGLYQGYFNGNINFFHEAVITTIKELPNDTIISKVSNGSNFSNSVSFTQNLNDTTTQQQRS